MTTQEHIDQLIKELSGITGELEKKINQLQKQVIIKGSEKELNRQKLTAKMYRDMRDERINGDWVADWDDDNMNKFIPALEKGNLIDLCAFQETPIEFYYRSSRFIEDLKALGWSEEELKIVWFRV